MELVIKNEKEKTRIRDLYDKELFVHHNNLYRYFSSDSVVNGVCLNIATHEFCNLSPETRVIPVELVKVIVDKII